MYAGKDSVGRDAITTLRRHLYSESDPYYYPTIGFEEPIVDLKATTVRAFYDRLYLPQNATLFVVGDLGPSASELPLTVQRLFGSYTPRPRAPPFVERRPSAVSAGAALERTFHAVPGGLTVVGFRTAPSSDAAHRFVTQTLAGGPTSRLHRALVATGAAHGVSAFTELGAHAAETYVFVEGECGASDVVSAVSAALAAPWTESELAEFAGKWRLSKAAEPADLEAHTNAWVDDYHLTRDVESYARGGPHSPGFMDELRATSEALASAPPFSVRYRKGPSPEHGAEHEALVARASDAEHARTPESKAQSALIGAPMAAAFASAYASDLASVAPPTRPSAWGVFGQWAAARDGRYGLTRIGCSPCGDYPSRAAAYVDGLYTDALTDWRPTSVYAPHSVSGGFAGLNFVASAKCDDDESKAKLGEMLKFFTRPGAHASLGAWWSEHGARKVSEWSHALDSRAASGTTVAGDWCAARASDNHLSLAERRAALESFDVASAGAAHDALWAKARRFVTSDAFSDVDRPSSGPTALWSGPSPRAIGAAGSATVQANPGLPLNQVVVALARPGATPTSDHRYWGERALAETMLFASLGSRLMHHMRELDGDVYTCSGHLGLQAADLCNGYDQITLLVRPGGELAALAKARAWLAKECVAPFTEAELKAAKQIVCARWRDALNEESIVGHWCSFANVRELDQIMTIPEKVVANIDALTARAVTRWWARQSRAAWDREVIVC